MSTSAMLHPRQHITALAFTRLRLGHIGNTLSAELGQMHSFVDFNLMYSLFKFKVPSRICHVTEHQRDGR